MSEPTTDPHTAAIEAGARASYERYRAERPDLQLKPWDEAGPNMRRSELAEAEIHYDAMAETIRAGERAATFDEIAIGLTIYAGMQPDVEAGIFRRAAQLVREIGAKR